MRRQVSVSILTGLLAACVTNQGPGVMFGRFIVVLIGFLWGCVVHRFGAEGRSSECFDGAEFGFTTGIMLAVVAVSCGFSLAFSGGEKPRFNWAEADDLALNIGKQGEGIEVAVAGGFSFHFVQVCLCFVDVDRRSPLCVGVWI